mgnify:CR=1 FL=1
MPRNKQPLKKVKLQRKPLSRSLKILRKKLKMPCMKLSLGLLLERSKTLPAIYLNTEKFSTQNSELRKLHYSLESCLKNRKKLLRFKKSKIS